MYCYNRTGERRGRYANRTRRKERKRIKEKKRGRFGKEVVKIGQGGTLDPLADGVLGIGPEMQG